MKQYLKLLEHILNNGTWKQNRTGVKTISVFGYQTRYDLSKDFPLLTTKKVYFKGIVHELLWFIKGDTNIAYLVKNGCNIWNDWPFDKYKKSKFYQNETMEMFVQKIKNDPKFAKKFGQLGPVYGKQWRDFFGVDQLKDVINDIKNNPDSRRMIVCSWNAKEIPNMALAPCHCLFQFYVSNNKLSCQLYQRSADAFLGVPFNIASYALLTIMICHLTGLKPGEFIHTFGDLHIYENHLDQVKLQLSRKPRKLPKLKINNQHNDILDIKYEDIELIGYNPDEPIKAPVAV